MAEANWETKSDQELVGGANVGDAAAFEVLYQRYRQWVADLAWRLTGDESLAADVMQETFLYLLGKFPGFELRSQMKTYLYPIIRHIAITAAQKRRRIRPLDGPAREDWTEHSGPPGNEASAVLANAVAELPGPMREVLILRYADGLPIEAIAVAVECPIGTVKSRLHNALRSLRAHPGLAGLIDAEP